MNDNLQPLPDEHLEARITAYVLGEASPFESAELESLISKSPELKLFLNRTRALHILITEAETTANRPDRDWKLPAGKRESLEHILGPTHVPDNGKERRIRRVAFRAAIGIAAVLLLTFFSAPMVIRQRKKADRMESFRYEELAASATIDSSLEGESDRDDTISRTKKEARDSRPRIAPPSQVPLPEIALQTPSQDFGGSENLVGQKVSRFDRQALAQIERKPKAPSAAPVDAPMEMEALASNSLRSGDAAITRNSVDAILNNPGRTAGRESNIAVTGTLTSLEIDEAELADSGSGVDAFAPAPSMEPMARLRLSKTATQPEGGAGLDETVRTDSALTFNHSVQSDSSRALSVPQDVASAENKKAEHAAVDAFADQSSVVDADAQDDSGGFIEYGSRIEPAAESDSRFKLSLGGERGNGGKTGAATDSDPLRSELLKQVNRAWGMQGNVSGTGTVEWNDRLDTNTDYAFRGLALPSSQATSSPVTPAAPTAFESRNIGAKLGIEVIREFQYPTEYEPAEAPVLGDIPIAGKLFKPAPVNLVDLAEEIPATQEPFSTFSLNISDASFQIARAAIEKGEQPDPASIKPEQFYNAVDYGDPAPSSLEPVSAAIDQTAHPVIPGRNLVRVALRTASTGRSAAQPLRLTLLVDQSGSMVREDRRAAMETALEQLATLLTENDEVTVIGFSRTPRLLADSMKGNEAGKLPALINQTANEGGTNLEQAINLASELALRHKLDGAQNRIVLFTDGAANLGNANPERLSDKIETLRQQGLAFDIAGIGTNDLNDNLLAELARHGNGRYYLVGENTGASLAAQLAGAFRPAAENVKVQVKLNPQRVGNYKLIGFEKDRLKTEDFRNDSVDAAELAADEAGVAMYQVETLPEGSGEIGEVSVRFRDTASGEMVERTWTIPYESSTPAFDKADPKTQLATLSLLAAQKLQPGPLADAISFRNFSETIARLKQTYASDAKAQQMLNFVNALK